VIQQNFYIVVDVERSDPPAGGEGRKWCRYVIANGSSRIAGVCQGTLEQVRRQAELFAEDLNARAERGYSLMAPKRR
jgi:hypothetical protein